jgi:hypothetical protein
MIDVMVDELLRFADQFPIVEHDPNRPEPPQIDIKPYLLELLEISGYDDAHLHQGVEIETTEDAYEPTDIDYRGTIRYPVYISNNAGESAHIVGYGDMTIPPLADFDLDHASYEKMRLYHEVADAEITICLTPYDLLVYSGRPLFAGESPEPPIVSYPLHEGLDRNNAEELSADLEPPADLC